MVADDEPDHRGLIEDILTPLGFTVIAAADAVECRALAGQYRPDIFLLDISMPGMNGWELARVLRSEGFSGTPIVIVSADVADGKDGPADPPVHDGYVVKPLLVSVLLEQLRSCLQLEWTYAPEPPGRADVPAPSPSPWTAPDIPPAAELEDLLELVRIGHVRGLQSKLDALEQRSPQYRHFICELRELTRGFQLKRLGELLETLLR